MFIFYTLLIEVTVKRIPVLTMYNFMQYNAVEYIYIYVYYMSGLLEGCNAMYVQEHIHIHSSEYMYMTK